MTTSPPSPLDLDRLSELLEKATPGPWFYRPRENKHGGAWIADHPERGRHAKIIVLAGACFNGSDDYELIAEAVTALPTLISELTESRALKARMGRMEEALKEIATYWDHLICAPEDALVEIARAALQAKGEEG